MARILMAVTPENFPDVITPDVMAEIEKLADVVKRPDLRAKPSPGYDPHAAYLNAIRDVQPDIIVTAWGSPLLTMDAYRACPNLKYLCHCAGTVRKIVERDVIAAGLLVTNWGNVIARTVAEAALMMTLACLRRVSAYVRLMDRGGWRDESLRSESLFEQTVGLHGFGGIAQEFVRLLRPFGCTVSTCSPHAPDSVLETWGVRRETSLARLYSENRIVSVHASNTPENFHVVNADILARMRDGAVLVNTARGAVIDEKALAAKLAEGKVWAALDVFEQEPLPPDSPLRRLNNVLLIPHEGGPTQDRQKDMGRHALQNLRRYLSGQPVSDVVTAEKYDLIT